MQKNDIKGCCQAETDEENKENREGPLTQKHKKTSFTGFGFPGLFSCRQPLFTFCCHLGY